MTFVCPAGHVTESERRNVSVISCPHLIGQRMQCSLLARSTTPLRGLPMPRQTDRHQSARGSHQLTLEQQKESTHR